MFLAMTAGVFVASMVGPMDEPAVVRISRPGAVMEVVTLNAAGDRVAGGVVVPDNTVGGGGVMTVVGEADRLAAAASQPVYPEPQVLYTEQLFRAFDTSHFGYSYINWPNSYRGNLNTQRCGPSIEQHPRQAGHGHAQQANRFPRASGR